MKCHGVLNSIGKNSLLYTFATCCLAHRQTSEEYFPSKTGNSDSTTKSSGSFQNEGLFYHNLNPSTLPFDNGILIGFGAGF
jgi:hypothetical protein